ncbi:MAG: hypothetical protein ACK5NF_06925 [Bacilli bacterium]
MDTLFLLGNTWCNSGSKIDSILNIVHQVYLLIIIAIPIVIIVVNGVRFLMAFLKSDGKADDAMKAAQTSLFKSLIAFAVVLLVNVIVVAVIDVVDNSNTSDNKTDTTQITGCINKIIKGSY